MQENMPRKSPNSGNSNDGSGNPGPGTGIDTSVGAVNDSSSDSDIDASTRTEHGITGDDGGEIDTTGDGFFDLPLGVDESHPSRKRDSSGNGSGSGDGKRRRSRARTDKGRAEAKETASSIPDVPPREVSYDKLGGSPSDKKSAKNQELTLKFFAETWGLVFHAAAVFTKDVEWKLPESDAEELAERTERWLGSLDAKRLAAARKKIAKIQPALSLGIALSAVIIPRVAHTRSLKRAVSPSPKQEQQNGTGKSRTEATSTAANSNNVDEQTGKRPTENAVRSVEFLGRSIRREDGSIFPEDVD